MSLFRLEHLYVCVGLLLSFPIVGIVRAAYGAELTPAHVRYVLTPLATSLSGIEVSGEVIVDFGEGCGERVLESSSRVSVLLPGAASASHIKTNLRQSEAEDGTLAFSYEEHYEDGSPPRLRRGVLRRDDDNVLRLELEGESQELPDDVISEIALNDRMLARLTLGGVTAIEGWYRVFDPTREDHEPPWVRVLLRQATSERVMLLEELVQDAPDQSSVFIERRVNENIYHIEYVVNLCKHSISQYVLPSSHHLPSLSEISLPLPGREPHSVDNFFSHSALSLPALAHTRTFTVVTPTLWYVL
ncbi:MAG: hypothetical protein OD811_00485 [Alphaproteobacteria bacterium]